MNEQTETLIAIGASVAAHCQPCLQHHVAHAQDLGIANDQIRHAIQIGRMVGRGAASALQQYEKQLFEESAQKTGCCGGGEGGCCS